jgi:hypothetical protein
MSRRPDLEADELLLAGVRSTPAALPEVQRVERNR